MNAERIAPARAVGDGAPRRRSAWNVAFMVGVAIVVVVNAMMIAMAFTHTPVGDDEGFNLAVARNLVTGGGYSPDGLYRADTAPHFDATITTGPLQILPVAVLYATGVDLATAGRIIGVASYLVLVAALAVFGARISGRWGAVAATSVPLLLDLYRADSSSIFGPGDLLGEYLATALVILAVLAARRRPYVAGLLLGLAIMTKLVALFAGLGLLAALWWGVRGHAARAVVRTGVVAGIGILTPLVTFEAVKLAVLGVDGYGAYLDGHAAKFGEALLATPELDAKLAALLGSWFVPSFLVLLVLLSVAVTTAGALAAIGARSPRELRRLLHGERVGLVVAGLLAGAGTLGAWFCLTFTGPWWVRHPVPGLIPAAAAFAAGLVLVTRHLLRSDQRAVRRWAAVQGAAVAALAVAAVAVHETSAHDIRTLVSLGHQREIAEAIHEAGATEVQGVWGPMVALAAVADVHATSIWDGVDPDALLVFDSYLESRNAAAGDALAQIMCGEMVFEGQVTVCRPNGDAAAWVEAVVADRDPRTPVDPATAGA